MVNLGFLGLGGNCLVASNLTLITFLNENDPFWLSTRTCPVDITVTGKGVVEFPPPDCSSCPECSWCTDTLNCDSNTNVDNKDLDCTITYPVGEKTTLTVKPAENWIFSDWQGNCDSEGTITVTPTGVQCHATFKELVDVDVTIIGEGIVEFDPLPSECSLCTATLACDSSTRADNTDFTCTAKYPVGDKVTMIAKPAKDWKFASWQGDCDSAGILTVANDTSCQATFHSGFMDIGNLRVYADSFTNTKAEPRVYTASGNVTLAKIGGNKILSIDGGMLKLDFANTWVVSVGQVSVMALDIKFNPKDKPKNILALYFGDLTINPSENSPVIKVKEGTRLANQLCPVVTLSSICAFVSVKNIFIKEDSITLIDNATVAISDVTKIMTLFAGISKIPGIDLKKYKGLTVDAEDIVLSQKGITTAKVTLELDDLFEKFLLSGMGVSVDMLEGTASATAKLRLGKYLEKSRLNFIEGIKVDVGFKLNPFILIPNSFSVTIDVKEMPFKQVKTIPTTPPTPVGMMLKSVSLGAKDMVSGRPLKIEGGAEVKLIDEFGISEVVEKYLDDIDLLSGKVGLLIEVFKKIEFSGNVDLLERFELANAKIGMEWAKLSASSYISASLSIFDILKGELGGSISGIPGLLEITGKVRSSVAIPGNLKFIGGIINNVEVEANANWRFNDNGKHQLKFSFPVRIENFDLVLCLDASNLLKKADLNVCSFKLIKLDKSTTAIGTRSARGKQHILPLNANYETVLVVVISEQGAPLFDLTLPDGTVHTPDNTPTAEESSEVGNIFFSRNEAAHEAYYAIKQPIAGDYVINILNETEIGPYQVEMWIPNNKPAITIDTPANDQTWDSISPVNITWTDSDSDNNAEISLYYDTDNSGYDGNLIAAGIMEDEVTNSYQWTISSEMQSGHYYIYAKIDDGENMPVFAYSPGNIFINNPIAPAVPQNVTVIPGDGNLMVSWANSAETNLVSYRVYLSETPGDGHYEYDFVAGLAESYSIEGLVNGKTYEVAVSVINEESFESLKSVPVQGVPNGTTPGGSPDLTVNTTASWIDQTTLQVRVENQGNLPSTEATIICYDGSERIDSQVIGSIPPGEYRDVVFSLAESGKQLLLVSIEEVLPTELQTSNNFTAVTAKRLPEENTGEEPTLILVKDDVVETQEEIQSPNDSQEPVSQEIVSSEESDSESSSREELAGMGTIPEPEIPLCEGSFINIFCNAEGKTFTELTVGKQGSVGNAVLAGKTTNQGWLANITLKPEATLQGGIITGYVSNEGTLMDFEFRGASIKGGTLAGTINNTGKVKGIIEGVHLAANTRLSGGKLAGSIAGDPTAPAVIENLTVTANTHLSGILLGENVILEEGVVIKPLPFSTILPSLGKAVSINVKGHKADVQSVLSGGVTLDDVDFAVDKTIASQQTLRFSANIQVDPAHIGKKVDILLVIGIEPPPAPYNGGIDTLYYTIDSQGQFNPVDLYAMPDVWMAQLNNSLEKEVILQSSMSLDLWRGPLSELAMHYFFVGYRLPNNTIIYNIQPIMVDVR